MHVVSSFPASLPPLCKNVCTGSRAGQCAIQEGIMELLVAACGLLCNKCPAYIATKNNDAVLAEQTAREWSVQFNADIRPEHIWCNGCMTDGGPKSCHCGQMCQIRACVLKRRDGAPEFETCAACDDRSGCSKLAYIVEHVPPAGALLEALAAFRKQFRAD